MNEEVTTEGSAPYLVALASSAAAALSFLAIVILWLRGGGVISFNWAPSWGLHFSFALDGLAALYALLASGIGLLVLIYSFRYIFLHLRHQHRPPGESVPYFAWLLLFLASMLGLATAQDLLLLFVFWELTTIASYFLIAYDWQKEEARHAALMALLVTGVASLCFLIGALILFAEYGTFSIPELIAGGQPGATLTMATALLLIAALAKSAQVPLHFWLPEAMAAPTPVSAYLHSAALVAAGVFLLSRLFPLFQLSQPVLDITLVIGYLSIGIGSALALTQDRLKRILAYSTVAQYGYVLVILGLNGTTAVASASFYVMAHALAKSGLFLAAGAITEATDEDRLSQIGRLWPKLPLLALATAVLGTGLAGLPLTIGFFKDDLFFEAALVRGWPFVVAAVAGAALTLAYMWRFWHGIFLEDPGKEVASAPLSLFLSLPIVLLALLVLVAGLYVTPFERLAEAAGAAVGSLASPNQGPRAPESLDLAYHADLRLPNILALTAYAVGLTMILTRGIWEGAASAVTSLGDRFGPGRWYQSLLTSLADVSDNVYRRVVPDIADRITALLVPTALLISLGLLSTPIQGAYEVSPIALSDLPLLLALALTAMTSIFVLLPKRHLTQALAFSAVSYSLALVFAFFAAPDVALVAVLIGTVLTPLYFGVLALLPAGELEHQAGQPVQGRRRTRDAVIGIIATASAFVVTWGVLSPRVAVENVAAEQIRLAPAAHAGDVVTAILTDFRGLDTLGEITVITIALVGILTLARARDEE